MAHRWPLVLLLIAALAAVAFFLLQEDDDDLERHAFERGEDEEYMPPELRGLPPSERDAWRARQAAERAARESAVPKDPSANDPVPYFEGVVVDAATGAPLAGALVFSTPHHADCPRLEAPFFSVQDGIQLEGGDWGQGQVRTNAQGRFALQRAERHLPPPDSGTRDIYVYASGYVFQALCAPAFPGEVTVRLEQGLALEGRVVDRSGRPVEGARIRARPAPETEETPGHATPTFAVPTTDAAGRFALTGLIPGGVLIDVEHAHYMPLTSGPHDPQDDAQALTLVLVPALRAVFHIRTDDGRKPEHPTLLWRTVEATPRSAVVLLKEPAVTTEPRESNGVTVAENEVLSNSVRLPCDARGIVLQVKADLYATWTSEEIRLPTEGGSETFEVKLTGDLATGSVRVTFEDDRGDPIDVRAVDVQLGIARLDPGAASSTYVLQQTQEHLRVTDLQAGSYRFTMASAAFAPVQSDVVVTVGQEAPVHLAVRPPARVRVRFTAPEATRVRFRLLKDGAVAPGVPTGSWNRGTDEATGQPILSAGVEGMTLSGLAGGTYVVEVVSDEYVAPPTTVRLIEGDLVEVEIDVRRR